MNLEEVEIVINKKGEVEVHVRGAKGPVCLEITRELEQALGGQIILREMTPEANELDQTQQDQLNIRDS